MTAVAFTVRDTTDPTARLISSAAPRVTNATMSSPTSTSTSTTEARSVIRVTLPDQRFRADESWVSPDPRTTLSAGIRARAGPSTLPLPTTDIRALSTLVSPASATPLPSMMLPTPTTRGQLRPSSEIGGLLSAAPTGTISPPIITARLSASAAATSRSWVTTRLLRPVKRRRHHLQDHSGGRCGRSPSDGSSRSTHAALSGQAARQRQPLPLPTR